MKRSALIAALLALSLTACGEKPAPVVVAPAVAPVIVEAPASAPAAASAVAPAAPAAMDSMKK